ncbi:hypothetical protein [Gillisia hiemivivida]|uniref:Uncharacterized protein n=1 Tax=Gillisia hiemivivida TaxID=291190 RepID=A0A5C6ZX43_9FLAO|nr:hypothetical protein [Gillisia hiemivivida]TXD93892.1 hypothetical protein ES724_08170 [Gillisia hiemivivida]
MIWKFKKTNKIILVGASFAVLFFRHFLIKEQKQTNKANLYETVFLGLMYCASESEKLKILNDLDLKEANYLENVKEVYWRPGNEIANRKGNLHKEFYSKVSQLDIMITYIYNPQILFKMVIMGIKYLVINPAQPQHLGNYLKKDSKGAKLTLKETFWGKYLNKTFLLIYLFSLASCVYNIATGRRNFRLTLTIILIMLIPLVFTATLVAGGINDFVKHNLSVYFMISILFLLLCSNVLEIIKSQSASQKVALF